MGKHTQARHNNELAIVGQHCCRARSVPFHPIGLQTALARHVGGRLGWQATVGAVSSAALWVDNSPPCLMNSAATASKTRTERKALTVHD